MAELTSESRDKLAKATFGLPSERKYPMPDKAHAANAKARARQQYAKGTITKAEYDSICAKADRVIAKAGGTPGKESDGDDM